MDSVASFERKQNYAQMLDWANIALTHRPEDKEAVAKKEEATRLLSEQKVKQQQYNSIIQRAEASFKEHEYQDALSQSDAALNLMPSSEQAKMLHDKARKALDDIAQVKEYLTRADLFLAQNHTMRLWRNSERFFPLMTIMKWHCIKLLKSKRN